MVDRAVDGTGSAETQGDRPIFGTKSEWAYERLRAMITDGEMAPGSRIVVRRLAQSFGLSEIPVREALRMLQRDGLVEFETHRGATVAPISSEIVIEALSARMWLEALALEEAVQHHTEATLGAVRDALDAAENAARAGDGHAFSVANRALHEALEAPAPGLLKELIADLWNRVWHARRAFSLFALQPGHIPRAQEEHRRLFAAVEARDSARARAVMEEHRAESLAAWRAVLAAAELPRGRP